MKNAITTGGLKSEDFIKTIDGKPVGLFILKNGKGTEVAITNYGAKLVAVEVPDKNGQLRDVVLGHPSIDEYLHSEEPYFGSVCGRTANRIAKGKFELEGKAYELAVNNGPNCLHGGIKGFNSVVWDAKEINDHTLGLTYLAGDGEEGYPGNLSVTVIYTLKEDNSLEIHYEAITDQTTILNLTNHSYFNLSGAGDPSICDHTLEIKADEYLPTDETSIPFGPAEKVKGTPFDFRTPHEIGERINEKNQQLEFGRGYDHTYILDKKFANAFDKAVECSSPKTGIVLEVYTDQPGVQLYTGNWMTGHFKAKYGKTYPPRAAVCFETQHFPDSIHHAEYPSVILKPEQKFDSRTVFKFSVKK